MTIKDNLDKLKEVDVAGAVAKVATVVATARALNKTQEYGNKGKVDNALEKTAVVLNVGALLFGLFKKK